eukprot:TRINITY_DN44366_c0_g1_i1.p1 TRINITY_DN44366_c0_g1~~TRINITY_DN44366_c0_g1_i1.p1  ORF type:complete len:110 (+),score=0.30 TRINITY_DN44366_c0_g1_i1:364-693(+)
MSATTCLGLLPLQRRSQAGLLLPVQAHCPVRQTSTTLLPAVLLHYGFAVSLFGLLMNKNRSLMSAYLRCEGKTMGHTWPPLQPRPTSCLALLRPPWPVHVCLYDGAVQR